MLIYYHIPKTAGTSCKRVLETWYPDLMRDTEFSDKVGSIDLADRELGVAGHFACRLTGHPLALLDLVKGLRTPSEHCLFTILRDPFEHAVSAYYHLKDVDKDVVGGLTSFLEQGHPFQHSMALGISSAEHVQLALDSFSVVGDTADMQRSLDLLADVVGKPRIEVPAVRIGTRDPQLLSLTAADRSRFEKQWPLEFEIYEAARDRLKRGVNADCGVRGNRFAYVDETFATIETLRQQLDLRRHEAALANAGAELPMPELAPGMAMLLARKDDQIRELEGRVLVADEHNTMLRSNLDSQQDAATEQRDSLISKLQIANDRAAALKSRLEERERQVKDARRQIQELTSKLDTVEAARADAVQELRAIAETQSNAPEMLGVARNHGAGASIANQPVAAWQMAMGTFMRDLEGALTDIRMTVGQLQPEPPGRLAASSEQDQEADDAITPLSDVSRPVAGLPPPQT